MIQGALCRVVEKSNISTACHTSTSATAMSAWVSEGRAQAMARAPILQISRPLG